MINILLWINIVLFVLRLASATWLDSRDNHVEATNDLLWATISLICIVAILSGGVI